ncbi:MAG TPA: hypothetical protein VMV92_40195, partial [Streptosporangiaceae bacterium]|nr:hypothetical protein [Streptosporangiaceae bacterium]
MLKTPARHIERVSELAVLAVDGGVVAGGARQQAPLQRPVAAGACRALPGGQDLALGRVPGAGHVVCAIRGAHRPHRHLVLG